MRELLFFYACGYINTFGKVNEELKDYTGRILANGHECSFYNGWKKELWKAKRIFFYSSLSDSYRQLLIIRWPPALCLT